MRIHMRSSPVPLPPAPPAKRLPTAIQMEFQAEELATAAQQQYVRLKKLYRVRNHSQTSDEEADSGRSSTPRIFNLLNSLTASQIFPS
jgi:hypothetical protein